MKTTNKRLEDLEAAVKPAGDLPWITVYQEDDGPVYRESPYQSGDRTEIPPAEYDELTRTHQVIVLHHVSNWRADGRGPQEVD